MRLVLEQVQISTADRPIVADISLSVAPGEVVALLGPSGTGKSLTLLAALGLLPAGVTCKGGIWLERGTARQAVKRGELGYIDQDARGALNPLIQVGPQLIRVARRAGQSHPAGYFLEKAGLSENIAGLYPDQLSGGMAQRVALAMAWAHNRPLWLADEWTSGLDLPIQVALLKSLMEQVREQKLGLFLVTHDPRLASLADHRIRLIPGPHGATAHPFTPTPLPRPQVPPTSVGPPAIILENLSYTSGLLQLGPLNLTLHQGEIVGLVGASGAGKTTLARLILGLLPFASGMVRISGQDPACTDLSSQVQLLFQDAGASLNPGLTIAEILKESAELFGQLPLLSSLVDRLGIQNRLTALPRQLSGGEKRRVTLAQVQLARPRILIADEPTAGLDAERQHKFLQDVLEKRTPDQLFLLISHDLPMLLSCCTRILVLVDGQLVDDFAPPAFGSPERHPWTRTLESLVFPT